MREEKRLCCDVFLIKAEKSRSKGNFEDVLEEGSLLFDDKGKKPRISGHFYVLGYYSLMFSTSSTDFSRENFTSFGNKFM